MLTSKSHVGSGNTTLLNTLAHRWGGTAVSQGSASIDGVHASRDLLQQISSYVEQEDALIGSLTVRETIGFAARLSLPRFDQTAFP